MTVKEIIEIISVQTGLSKSELARKIEMKQKENLLVPLSRNDGMGIRVRTLVEWLDKLGYQLVVTPVDYGEEMILDGENEL